MNQKYILSIGMSNYCLYGGGTNLAAKNYQMGYNDNNISYIYIAPLLLHGKKYSITKKYWSIIIDGNYVADLSTEGIIKYLQAINKQKVSIAEVHIHHFKSINFEEFERLLDYTDCPVIMFIHDYSTVCSNFTLLDSNMNYCGDGGIWKEKCHLCEHFGKSITSIRRYTEFWKREKRRISFVFPSEVAKEVWLSANPEFREKTRVIPHQTFCGRYEKTIKYDGKRKIKIAYVGSREFYKGWKSFYKLFQKYKEDNRYEWYYFGIDSVTDSKIINVYVDNKQNEYAMLDTLRNNHIDIVILWSICKETYSYTYFESFAAGAFVITNKNSGNIAQQVIQNKNGMVINDENELLDLFNVKIVQIIKTFQKSNIYCPKSLITNNELFKELNLGDNTYIVKRPQMGFLGFVYFVLEQLHIYLKQKSTRR